MSILMFETTKYVKGCPSAINVIEKDGVWNSKFQVRCHYPSPTGDMSDWLYFDVPCLTQAQAMGIAQIYANAFEIEIKVL